MEEPEATKPLPISELVDAVVGQQEISRKIYDGIIADLTNLSRQIYRKEASTAEQRRLAFDLRVAIAEMVDAEELVWEDFCQSNLTPLIQQAMAVGLALGKLNETGEILRIRKRGVENAHAANSYTDEVKQLACQFHSELMALKPQQKQNARLLEVSQKLAAKGHCRKRARVRGKKEKAENIPTSTIKRWINGRK